MSSDPWIIANVHTWLAYVAGNEGSFAEQESHLAIRCLVRRTNPLVKNR